MSPPALLQVGTNRLLKSYRKRNEWWDQTRNDTYVDAL